MDLLTIRDLLTQPILTLLITTVGSLLALIFGFFIVEWIREKLKKRVSLKTCISIAKEACQTIEKDFSPTLIWGFRRNGGGMARLMAPMFKNGAAIGVISSNTKTAVIKKINFNKREKCQKILVIIGKKFGKSELFLLKDIKNEITKIEKSEIRICSLVNRTEQTKQRIKEIINDEIDYTFFDDEKFRKASFPWDFDDEKTLKKRKINMTVGCGILCLFLCTLFILKITIPEKIKIGISSFDVESAISLKNLYERNLTNYANDHISMGTSMPPFKFEVEVNQTQDYTNVLEDVKNGKIQIAFITSYLCALENLNAYNKDRTVITIGYMKEGYSDTYKSWLIAKKRHFNNGKDLPDSTFFANIKKDIKNGEITVCLNEIRESGSTHILPKIFLLENGINPYDEKSCNLIYMQKKDMMQFLSKQKNSVGFISSSEYLKQFIRNNTSEWFIYSLDYLIPRDIVVANAKWWGKSDKNEKETKKETKKQKQILEALSKGEIKCIVPESTKKDSIRRYNFKNYVGSGVIMEVCTKDSMIISIMPQEHDFLKLGTKWSSGEKNVKIVKYKAFDNEMRVYEIGSGTVKALNASEYKYQLKLTDCTDKSLDIQLLDKKALKKIFEGAHVLPKHL